MKFNVMNDGSVPFKPCHGADVPNTDVSVLLNAVPVLLASHVLWFYEVCTN